MLDHDIILLPHVVVLTKFDNWGRAKAFLTFPFNQ